jgi:succinoglycan biosynthesis protein ExoA
MGNELNPSDGQAVKVTVIAACRNEVRHIRDFLDSLLAQDTEGIPWEGIIADGQSDDGTREILEDYAARHPELRVITNQRRIVSTGLNAAIRQARGEIIIRMDAHTSYAQNYCRRCLEELEIRGADNVGGPARTRSVGIRARAIAAAYHSAFSTGGARFHDVDYEGWVDTVPYGCWRKSTLIEVGLFDESLVRNQDDELNLRILLAGGKIWQSPSIVSWYSPRHTLSRVFRQYFQYGFWKAAVMRKHRRPASWRHFVPVSFILASILLSVAMVLAKAFGAKAWFELSSAAWVSMIGLYVAALLVASLVVARKTGWIILPHLPAVFMTFHMSYGLGFLTGLCWYVPRPTSVTYLPPVFTRISR